MSENTKSQYATDRAADLADGIRENIAAAGAELTMAQRRLDEFVKQITGNRASIDFDELQRRISGRRG
jgi:hypothetical protein